jgi:uncharacterized protein YcbX
MKAVSLWRYPVKSMQGERRDSIRLSARGIEGDRRFGVLDPASGTILSAKKEGRLLQARALLAGVELTIRLPNGETAMGTGPRVDAALSGWLERAVHLIEAREGGRATYEMPADFEDDASDPVRWQGPKGSFADSAAVHLLTTASLGTMAAERPDLDWQPARFRPNILIEAGSEGCVEQQWIGRRVTVGEVVLHVHRPCSRCVMTTREQPGSISRQLDVLRHVNTAHGTNLGVLARVVHEGTLSAGDPVAVGDP